MVVLHFQQLHRETRRMLEEPRLMDYCLIDRIKTPEGNDHHRGLAMYVYSLMQSRYLLLVYAR